MRDMQRTSLRFSVFCLLSVLTKAKNGDWYEKTNSLKMGRMLSNIFLLVKALELAAGNPSYSYRFEVYPVDKCPMNSTEFETAAKRRNCTKGTRYLCAPDKYLLNLIEFCSDITKSLYKNGNCLRLEGTGDLNHYRCVERFTSGCPTTPYTDDEIYTNPMCLTINRNLKCFAAERDCIEGFLSSTTDLHVNGSKTGNGGYSARADRRNTTVVIFIFMIVYLILTVGIVGFILYKRRKKDKEKNSLSGLATGLEPDKPHFRTSSFSRKNESENEQLISVEAEVNQPDKSKATEEVIKPKTDTYQPNTVETALITACYKGQLNQVEKLIKSGANVNQKDNEKTPLTTACYLGHLDIVKILIENKADTNQGDGNETPLTAACYLGQLSVVEKLIEHGADVNQEDNKCSPLETAYERGHFSVVRVLMDANAVTPKKYEHDNDFRKLVEESIEKRPNLKPNNTYQ